LKLPTA